MNRRTISLFIVIFAASICAGWLFVNQDSTAKLEVCEATFRSQLTPDSLDVLRTETFFLGTGSMLDPQAPWNENFPNEFYARFQISANNSISVRSFKWEDKIGCGSVKARKESMRAPSKSGAGIGAGT